MTSDAPHEREYRSSVSRRTVLKFVPACVPLVAGVAALVYDMATDDGTPFVVPMATAAAFAAAFVFLGLLLYRGPATATICDEYRLTVRGVFRTRSTAWSDVQGIEIEKVPGSDLAHEGTPTRRVVLYDAAGNWYGLPHLDDRRCQDLPGEVAALREVWLLRRGPAWESIPEVRAKIRDRHRRMERVPLWLIAFLSAFLAFWAGAAIVVIALIAGAYKPDADPSFLLRPVTVLAGLPVVASIASLAVTVSRRR